MTAVAKACRKVTLSAAATNAGSPNTVTPNTGTTATATATATGTTSAGGAAGAVFGAGGTRASTTLYDCQGRAAALQSASG